MTITNYQHKIRAAYLYPLFISRDEPFSNKLLNFFKDRTVFKGFFFCFVEWFSISQTTRSSCRSSSGNVSFFSHNELMAEVPKKDAVRNCSMIKKNLCGPLET